MKNTTMQHNEPLIGESAEFLNMLRATRLIAATDVTTLICGDSGTGKELLAKEIHRHSPRNEQAYICLNCAALPDSLLEAELFGYQKGAFTGATEHHSGYIKQAHKGTLFLDEIAEFSLSAQAKLLRFLESGECQSLGKSGIEKVDVRIIAATNQNLTQRVKTGHFRQDLFYRLNVIPIRIPALHERGKDVSLLLSKLTAKLAMQHRLDAPRYSVATIEALQKYDWPGNVRELRNLCERMLILFPGKTIQLENLPVEIRHTRTPSSHSDFALPDQGIKLDALESSMIQQALTKTKGNQSKAARLLGLSRGTLIYRMKKFALE
jgi:transcriptional regulator with PAS, ATPase and Fis domain